MLLTIMETLFVSFAVLAVTMLIFRSNGVGFRNYGTFRKLMRMKRAGSGAGVIAKVLFDYVMREKTKRHARRFDMTFIGIFDAQKQDETLVRLIAMLLENGVKPISLDKRNGKIVLVHGEPYRVERQSETM